MSLLGISASQVYGNPPSLDPEHLSTMLYQESIRLHLDVTYIPYDNAQCGGVWIVFNMRNLGVFALFPCPAEVLKPSISVPTGTMPPKQYRQKESGRLAVVLFARVWSKGGGSLSA